MDLQKYCYNPIFNDLECCELLDHPDYPLLSIERELGLSQKYLSYLVRYLSKEVELRMLAPVSDETLEDVREGRITVFEAFVAEPANKFIFAIHLNSKTGKVEATFVIPMQDFLAMDIIPKDYGLHASRKEDKLLPIDKPYQVAIEERLCWEDLSRPVDFSVPFTIRDVLNLIVLRSEIPIDKMCQMVQCNYLFEYFEEAQKPLPPADDKSNCGKVEYLELAWTAYHSLSPDKGVQWYDNSWDFSGVGFKGVMGEDIINFYRSENSDYKPDPTYREGYAIEFSPLNEIADLPIRVKSTMSIENGDLEYGDSKATTLINFIPKMTVFDMIYSIFWELSFMGAPEKRDEMKDELNCRVKEIEEDKVELISGEEAFSKIFEGLDVYREKRKLQKNFTEMQNNSEVAPIYCSNPTCVKAKLLCVISKEDVLELKCPCCHKQQTWDKEMQERVKISVIQEKQGEK